MSWIQTQSSSSAELVNSTRLFVPLADLPFRWFASGKKHWELRRLGRQYTDKQLKEGRRVELRRGYSDKTVALWGKIGKTRHAASITDFFREINFREVIPDARTQEDAIEQARSILQAEAKGEGPVIGFQVNIDPVSTMRLDPRYFPLVRSGRKRSTIRAGVRQIPPGVVEFVGGQDSTRVLVTGVEAKRVDGLSEEDARLDGFATLPDLKKALRNYYPGLSGDAPVTLIKFQLLDRD